MLYSLKHNFFFVHIPKTAGTSITSAFTSLYDDGVISGGKKLTGYGYHMPILVAEKNLGSSIINNMYKFTFIRNPWDQLFSWYSMLTTNRNKKVYKDDFKEWLMHKKHSLDNHFLTGNTLTAQNMNYVDWLVDSKGEINIDFIGRFESLNEDMLRLTSALDLPQIDLPHLRKNKSVNYRDIYDDELKEYVSIIRKKDIQMFNYTF